MNSFYEEQELMKFGFQHLGTDVQISRKASVYSPSTISLGDHVRIDDFCILSGHIEIGNYVHISAYTALYGKGTIRIGNYCGCSPRCTLFSQTDDFSGEYMIGPMIDEAFTNVLCGPIVFEDYVQLGANSIVMPNVTLHQGAVSGAFSFVKDDLEAWSISVGIPARKVKDRSQTLLTRMKEGKCENE